MAMSSVPTTMSTPQEMAGDMVREEPKKLADTHRVPGQYIYEANGGVRLLMGTYCSPADIEKVQDLQLEASDVIIASYPKTGTTFLQECVWLVLNNGDVTRANQSYTYDRVPFVEDGCRDNMTIFHSLAKPRIMKTHLPYSLLPKTRNKLIYIYRNPRDTLVSFYHFYRSTKQLGNFAGSWHEYFDMFYRVNDGMLYYGNYLEHLREFWRHKDDKNMLTINYESMVRNHADHVRKIGEFLGVELSEETVAEIVRATNFETMKENPKTNLTNIPDEVDCTISPFIRNGKVGDWKNYFNEDEIEKLDQMCKEKIGDLGIEFIFD